jgi:hypothetical protein
MSLKYVSAAGGPVCYESANVRVVDGEREIPYTGSLVAVLVRAQSSDQRCERIGMIFDAESTLIVDCLHSDAEVASFQEMCRQNAVALTELAQTIAGQCPPPANQLQVEGWADRLFRELRPTI